MSAHYLDRLFRPRSVALFGASLKPDSLGTFVFANLRTEGLKDHAHAVNPRYDSLDGRPCYASIAEVPEAVDLAVIATPAPTVPGLIHACGEQGVGAAVVLSAGFGEAGAEGERLQRALVEEARKYGLRLLGPNCLGLISPHAGLNATFSKNRAQPGSLALVSQSGALCTAILDWAEAHQVGFSAVVSLGDAADLDFGDVLDYLALDPHTRSILLYVEGLRDARAFMSGLRAAARMKPVIVIKAGRHREGARAALSHTGALVGGDDAFDAALQRAGAVRVMTVEQLFAAAQLLATRHRVRGNRLAIVTNAGGPGVLATDRAVDLGVALAGLGPDTLERLDAALPPAWSRGNPVDILGDAGSERYGAAVTACIEDPDVDGLLVMLTPQAMTQPLEAARTLVETTRGHEKPVLACWMGEAQVQEAWDLFAGQNLPAFSSPEKSVEAFAYLTNYLRNQQLLMQVPGPLATQSEPDIEGARLIIEGALAERRTRLNPSEAKALLAAFRIPVMPGVDVHSAHEALVAAESIGFPVALKVNAPDVLHKSDVDGVRLNIEGPRSVRGAYQELIGAVERNRPHTEVEGVVVERMYHRPHGRELLVGIVRDPVFGPLVVFGGGGTMVEVLHDRAVALPPLNSFIARDLIAQTRVSRMLGPFRNLPAADLQAVVEVLRRVSEMACELPGIRELDINPLVADDRGAVALDVRVILEPGAPALDRYGHMAIHPYPAGLVRTFQLSDGTDVTIRPIRPEDAEIEDAFVRNLSPQAKYFRFMQAIPELTHQMLVRFTQIDYHREMALIAVVREEGQEVEVAVGRYATKPDGRSCEFALVVGDEWQRKGIGSRIMTGLMETARAKGFETMEGQVLTENRPMLKLMDHLGFRIAPNPQDPGVRDVVKDLRT